MTLVEHVYDLNKTIVSIYHLSLRTYNWVYPRKHINCDQDWTIHFKHDFDLDIKWLVDYFTATITRPEMNDGHSNAMLLNLGLHFIRSASFEEYKKVLDGVIKAIQLTKVDVVWRTTTSIYKRQENPEKRFQTNQVRVELKRNRSKPYMKISLFFHL